MTLEFIGMIQPREQSETHPARGPAIDPGYLVASAQAHEAHAAEGGGFDRVLIGWHSNGPDGFQLAAHAAAHTKRVGFLVAHRPGFQAPTTAARAFATLDQLSGGRAAIHVISGGDDAGPGARRRLAGQGRPLRPHRRVRGRPEADLDRGRAGRPRGRVLPHPGRLARGADGAAPAHPDLLRRRVRRRASASPAGTPTSTRCGARRGRRCAEIISRVRAEAAKHGRQVRFSLSFRPILGATEAEAWARAERHPRPHAWRCAGRPRWVRRLGRRPTPGRSGCWPRRRSGDRPEGRLYTAIARVTGARGNTTALVGTPEQVAEAFLDYHALGVTTFLIRGFDPLEDALEYGRTLLPLTRRLLASRTQHQAAAE